MDEMPTCRPLSPGTSTVSALDSRVEAAPKKRSAIESPTKRSLSTSGARDVEHWLSLSLPVAVITNEGVIMVDDKFEQNFDEIMANVKKKPPRKPVNIWSSARTITPTTAAGTPASDLSIAEIISTRNAHDGIVQHKQSNAPNDMIPARVTFTDETDVFLGGKEVRAKYYMAAATPTAMPSCIFPLAEGAAHR